MSDLYLRQAEIRLDTRRGNPIPNYLDRSEPIQGTWDQCEAFKRQYPAPIEHRPTNPTFVYNCHGLAFASRRTQIVGSADLRKMLSDDDYVPVAIRDVQGGDVVLYIDERNDIFHSGVIMRVERPGLLTVPWVLSKWGGAHEVIHPVGQCEYAKYARRIEYYRIVR
jgi:hypothetical protein